MIDVKNISKYFGENKALDDISLQLNLGEVIALLGENGAGKSTLMRIVCGYLPMDKGSVSVCGYDINIERVNALLNIGYVPELSSLYSDMLVYDYLKWLAKLWKIKDIEKQIMATSEQMNIKDVLHKKIETLSKGYKKRVEIAGAILHRPKILILDEPTDGLDPNQKNDIRSFILSYAKENLVLVSTHVLEDAEIASRVLMLSKGQLINDSTITEFKKNSKNENLSEAFRLLSKG